jgi:hypothetical protein
MPKASDLLRPNLTWCVLAPWQSELRRSAELVGFGFCSASPRQPFGRAQKRSSWELRAAASMARPWRHRGKPQQARELLAPVYGWFTEGHNTRDLKEAKALLEELAP